MIIALRLLLLACTVWSLTATASFAMSTGGCGGECASCHALSKSEADTIFKEYGTVKSIAAAPVRGLFEVILEKEGKTALVYLDYGKKHLVAGQLFDLATRKVLGPTALPEPPRVERVDPKLLTGEQSLVMGNPLGNKRLFVFTDPDCPYCAQFHAELKKLVALEPDLAVFIKLFPLKMHPHAYDKARVIMGEGSLELLERSFAGEKLPPVGAHDAKSVVDRTMRLAESIGISATPTLILPDGKVLPGVHTVQEMRQLLAGKKP